MDNAQVEELNRSFRIGSSKDQTKTENIFTDSIGLNNVNSRLQLKFGNEYGLSIASEIDEGTCASIRLPLNPKEGEEINVHSDDCR